MKILIISDKESASLWDHFDRSLLDGVDLILSCGDVDPEYLRFIVSLFNGPLLYVHGNHDDKYKTSPPDGCICVDGKLYVHEGLRILGLGGSMRYKPDGSNQYTEKQMHLRIKHLIPKIKRKKGFDILLTHSPALGLGDGDDLPHKGFAAFVELLDTFSPKYMIHGHVHMNYGHKITRESSYKDTTIINGYEKYFIEI